MDNNEVAILEVGVFSNLTELEELWVGNLWSFSLECMSLFFALTYFKGTCLETRSAPYQEPYLMD